MSGDINKNPCLTYYRYRWVETYMYRYVYFCVFAKHTDIYSVSKKPKRNDNPSINK